MIAWYKFSIFFQMIMIGLSGLIPIYWRDTLGISESSIGYLSSSAMFVALTAPIAFGRLGNGRNNTRIIFACFLIYGSASLSFLAFPFISVQALAVVAQTVAQWGILTLVPVGVLGILSSDIGRKYGNYRRIGSLGFLTGLLGIGSLTDFYGIEIIFPLSAAAAIIAALPFVRKITSKPPLIEITPTTYRMLIAKPNIKPLLIGLSIFYSFFSGCAIYLPLRLKELDASNSFVAFTIALCGITALFTLPTVGRLTEKYNPVSVLCIIPAFATLRTVCYGLPGENVLWFPIIQLLHIPTWVLFDVTIVRLLKGNFTHTEFSRMQALVHISCSAGMAFGSLCFAIVTGYTTLQSAFLIVAPLSLASMPLFLYAARQERNSIAATQRTLSS